MSFLPEAQRLSQTPLQPHFEAVSKDDVRRIVGQEHIDAAGFLALLSPAAAPHLEAMGRRAHALTLRNFGRTISLFTPLYVSNHCANHCRYCGFAAPNTIPRSQLSLDEVRAEGQAIAATGLKHLLLLTGEAPRKAGVEYLEACVRVLRPLFPSISLEVYPMETADYARLVQAGVDGLTVFQETYDPVLYAQLHPAGPKRDYTFRLNTPQRGAEAGMRVVNIGALLGLTDWRQEIYATGLHAAWLQKRYPGVDVAVSLPRMRIWFVHAFKNTLLPVITVGGVQIGTMIAFTILTETVFQWGGLGFLFLEAVERADTSLLVAYLIFVGIIFVVVNTAVDIIYGLVNPMVRITGRK